MVSDRCLDINEPITFLLNRILLSFTVIKNRIYLKIYFSLHLLTLYFNLTLSNSITTMVVNI